MESEIPPTLSDITAEREKLSTALKIYKFRAMFLLGVTIICCLAAMLYLNEILSESIDMIILNAAVAVIFVVAMTLNTIGERQGDIKTLEPYENLEEVQKIKSRSSQAAVYLTQIKDRDVVVGEMDLIKGLILEQEKRDAAQAKKQKNKELRRKYLAGLKADK